MKNKLFVLVFILFLCPSYVKANIMCNDGTPSPSCADCHRGCCSYHGGCASGGSSYSNNSYSNSNSFSNNTNSYSNSSSYRTPQKVVEKSSDNSIKEIKIDGTSIQVNDSMNINLSEKTMSVDVSLNDYKANAYYTRYFSLKNGINNYSIKVVAENGAIRYYTITINNKLLSSNKKFKIYYNDKKLKIKNKAIETISVPNRVKRAKLKLVLNDSKSKSKIIGNKNLKVGSNKIKVIITAEDKSKNEYSMTVKRKGFFDF